MSVRILENRDASMAVLYDSVTETAFGPIFRDLGDPLGDEEGFAFAGEVAERFLASLGVDARTLRADVLRQYHADFLAECEENGYHFPQDDDGPEPDGIRQEAGRIVPTSR